MKVGLDNPFNKPSLLSSRNLPSSSFTGQTSSYLKNSHIRTEHYPLKIWNFRDDHNNQFNPMFQGHSQHLSQISSFEKSLMLSGRNSRKRSESNYIDNSTRSRVESNPFHRKNLLISRDEVEVQIQRDLLKANYESYPYVSPSIRHSHRSSMDYGKESHKSDAIDPSKNTSLIMNLVQKIIPDVLNKDREPQLEVNQKIIGKEHITIRGKKFHQTNINKPSVY